MRQALVALLLLACGCASAQQAQPPIRAVALQPGEHLPLDGRLDHPAWQRAPAFDDFTGKLPKAGAAPPVRTEVRVLYDAQALYVGVTAFDPGPEPLRAPLVRFDQVNRTQDFVVVYIDGVGSRRAAQFFRINAAGSLADGLATAADDNEDFAPDFDWDGATARFDGGWTALLRLPFASLRFGAESGADWRIMVARRWPRDQFHLVTSVLIPSGAPSFIATMQPLAGLELPQSDGFLVVRPSVTVRHRDGGDSSASGDDEDNGTAVDASLDVKWRPRPELVVDATLNPDFSQVALDVPQLSGNQRFALSLTEKRPFFFESYDLLRTPTDAFYTRSFTAPRWGLRGTWRGGALAATAMVLADRGGGLVLLPGPYGTDAAEQPGSTALAGRLRWDSGAVQTALLWAARRYDDEIGANDVVGPDVHVSFGHGLRLRAQWLHARTRAWPDASGALARAPAIEGDRLYAKLLWNADRAEANIAIDDIDEGFRHDTGFVGQSGVRRIVGWASGGWHGLGPLNEFWFNVETLHVQDRATGALVERYIRPGVWMTGPHNLEAWVNWYGWSDLRLAADAALLAQRYWVAGAVFTPATWFSLLQTELVVGRFADTGEGVVRDGGTLYLSGHLRPLSRLEVEPSLWFARSDGAGLPRYRESALQGVAVWHLGPRSHLRLIAQRGSVERDGVASANRAISLTYAWRAGPGTVLYVGASEARDGSDPRLREAFVKLQFDIDQLRDAWPQRAGGLPSARLAATIRRGPDNPRGDFR